MFHTTCQSSAHKSPQINGAIPMVMIDRKRSGRSRVTIRFSRGMKFFATGNAQLEMQGEVQ